MKSNYKRLGNYIRRVDKRNSDLKVTKLRGLSMTKEFRETTSNIVGTDMSVYKVMSKWQFACDFMSVIRVNKLPVILKTDDEPNIVSPAYPVFEVNDVKELHPEYLMMWFRRSEFDRYAYFKCDSAIRGGFDWEELCDIELPIPSLAIQKEIVKEYNTIVNRIKLNEQLCQKLEETAQAIYKQWFVDFEFPDENGKPYKSNGGEMVESELGEIPKGWEVSKVGNEFNITIGRTPPRLQEEWFNSTNDSIDWISIKDIVSCGTYIFNANENLTRKAVQKFSIPIIPANTTIMSFKMSIGKLAITTKEMLSNEAIAHFIIGKATNISTEFIYCFFDYFKFNKLGTTSSIVDSINTKIIKDINIVVPCENIISNFNKLINKLFENKKRNEFENKKLKDLKSLLLSKLASIEI